MVSCFQRLNELQFQYLRGNFGDCVYSFIYMMELSTPFVSIRGILSTIGLKDSTAYVINGLIMLGTFFVCRVLMWPYVYYWYSGLVQMSVLQVSVDIDNPLLDIQKGEIIQRRLYLVYATLKLRWILDEDRNVFSTFYRSGNKHYQKHTTKFSKSFNS